MNGPLSLAHLESNAQNSLAIQTALTTLISLLRYLKCSISFFGHYSPKHCQETSAKALVVLTTPEKLDSLTRRWRSFSAFIMSIDLLLIDEVHLLNEPKRGPTVEAVVSRMKTIRMFKNQGAKSLRIVACSATIPNACDIGEWLSTNGKPAALFQYS